MAPFLGSCLGLVGPGHSKGWLGAALGGNTAIGASHPCLVGPREGKSSPRPNFPFGFRWLVKCGHWRWAGAARCRRDLTRTVMLATMDAAAPSSALASQCSRSNSPRAGRGGTLCPDAVGPELRPPSPLVSAAPRRLCFPF